MIIDYPFRILCGCASRDWPIGGSDAYALSDDDGDGVWVTTIALAPVGMFGIESFTSIINPPNSVILSVGAIVQKPVVKEGEIVLGNTMKLTLACWISTSEGV